MRLIGILLAIAAAAVAAPITVPESPDLQPRRCLVLEYDGDDLIPCQGLPPPSVD